VIRIAAVGDLHVGTDLRGRVAPRFECVEDDADILLLAGDLTRVGSVDEIDVLIEELAGVAVPKVAVLGNHDHHADIPAELMRRCRDGGIAVLEGESTVIEHEGTTLGIAGIKGFGGGFPGTSLAPFGEAEMKSFAQCATTQAAALEEALRYLRTDHTVVLMHYSPIRDTLAGEPPEIFPWLGSGHFGEVIDDVGADLVVHGHAHHGAEKGTTPGGIPVRNVAEPVIQDCYRVYHLGRQPVASDSRHWSGCPS
jgi:Icc-related predicted phosphoesterase